MTDLDLLDRVDDAEAPSTLTEANRGIDRSDTGSKTGFPKPAPKPLCRFYRLFGKAPKPRRADESADGMMAVRAYRYCEAVRRASAHGWYFFPPIVLAFRRKRNVTEWTYGGARGWYTLRGAQYPDFRQDFSALAPSENTPPAPLCLTAARDPGVVQIWSGYFAATAPGWSLLSRAPANISITEDYEIIEGLVDTDAWFGPLFINIRLLGGEVRFHPRYPLFQVQAVRRKDYSPSFEVLDGDALTNKDWARYAATVRPSEDQNHPSGHYAVAARRRIKRESVTA